MCATFCGSLVFFIPLDLLTMTSSTLPAFYRGLAIISPELSQGKCVGHTYKCAAAADSAALLGRSNMHKLVREYILVCVCVFFGSCSEWAVCHLLLLQS